MQAANSMQECRVRRVFDKMLRTTGTTRSNWMSLTGKIIPFQLKRDL